MKKINVLLLFAMLSAAAACNVEKPEGVPSPEGKTITMSVSANVVALEPETKTTFSGQELVWNGDETMNVLIGNETAHQTVTINNTKATSGFNTFAGSFTLNSGFTDSDMLVLTVPGGNVTDSYIYKDSGNTLTARIPISASQVQAEDGVMNGDNFPLYAILTDAERTACKTGENSYNFEGIDLKWACGVIRFNVVGNHPAIEDDEVVESVKLVTNGGFTNLTLLRLTNEACWSNTNLKNITVSLTNQPVLYGKDTEDSGVKVFMALPAQTNGNYINEMIVTTNKAVYKKTVSKQLAANPRGLVYQLNLKLGTFNRYTDSIEYSVDGGAWAAALPADGVNFSTLAVKSDILSNDDLIAIKDKINLQSNVVSLDLRQCEYESTIFPQVFGATSLSGASQKIGSVVFPSNITEIAQNAFRYCQQLQTVDLKNIEKLNAYAFNQCTALTTAVNTESIKSIGNYGFCNTDMTGEYEFPSVTLLGSYSFRNCTHLTRITIGPNCATCGIYVFTNCINLDHIYCYASACPAKSGTGTIFGVYSSDGAPGSNCTGEGHRQIHVPAAALADYQANAQWQDSATGYTLVALGGPEYSTDGGSTWASTLPEATSTYTTLAVRGYLTSDQLTAIADNLTSHYEQSGNPTVTLDLGSCIYESETFPQVFGASSASNTTRSINSVVLPSNVTITAASCFRACTNLVSADMSKLVTIGDRSFQGCANLTTVDIPKCTLVGIYAFSADIKITTINAPVLQTVGGYGFYRNSCTTIDLPEATALGNYSLAANTTAESKLTSVNLPKVTQLGSGANVNAYVFQNQDDLTSIYLPSVTLTGHYLFKNCKSLTTVVIGTPTNKTTTRTFGSLMFDGCTSLESVTLYVTTPASFGGATKNLVKNAKDGGTLYVPSESVDTYTANENWSLVTTESSWTITEIP